MGAAGSHLSPKVPPAGPWGAQGCPPRPPARQAAIPAGWSHLTPLTPPPAAAWGRGGSLCSEGHPPRSILQELSLLLLSVPEKDPGSSGTKEASARLHARGSGVSLGRSHFTPGQFLGEVSGLVSARGGRSRGSAASARTPSGAAPGAACGQQ